MKKHKIITALLAGISFLTYEKLFSFCDPNLPLSSQEIASLLGWFPSSTNLCGGYYQEPEIVLNCQHPPDIDAAITTITAEHTMSFSTLETSRLEGNVVFTQPGRKLTADQAILYRDPLSHAISQILLQGNVHYFEAGKHLVSQIAFMDLQKKYVQLNNVLYRLAKPTPRGVLNAWGQAKCAIRISNQDIRLTNASYTTCPPINPTWKILASKLHIDRELGWGSAINTFFYLHDVPLIWIPYFTFPVDKRRKTGFLFPTIGYSNDAGLNIRFPYYLNLAPNYDATLVPGYLYRRGLITEAHFRYLTCKSNGRLDVEFLPYDREFAKFRESAPYIFGVNECTLPFLRRLENYGNSRGRISFNDCTHFNAHWWGSLDLNYVTDDYFLQDFAYNPYGSSIDQLPNQATINYADDNWRFYGTILTYQTLHPINQQPVFDQYSRIPQLYLTSDFPECPEHLNFQINSEFVYFDHPHFFVTPETKADGERLHIQPSINLPFIFPASYFIPKLQLDATFYNLNKTCDEPQHIARVLPIFDIDTGVYLEKCYGKYTQTLEPRLFYLFVPYANQNDIPLFDTTLPLFDFEQLFRTNRFVGYDRLGDANQLSFALTTRLLNSETGDQNIRFSIGQTFYFIPPNVCLIPNCCNDFYAHKSLSPLVAELNYFINCSWDTVASLAIDPDDQGLNNASIKFHYHPSPRNIFNVGYDFVRKGDTLTAYQFNSSRNNLNRISLGLAWQLNPHWQALANWNYNLSHGHPEAYFYGFQYDSCCWAFRIVASRILVAENMNDQVTYQTNYYVQLELKGLGNIGNSDPGKLLTSSIFGYQDTFRG
jgi:LPS-assembly protein